jgi:hypothetical protein
MRDPVTPKNKTSAPAAASNTSRQGRIQKDLL